MMMVTCDVFLLVQLLSLDFGENLAEYGKIIGFHAMILCVQLY